MEAVDDRIILGHLDKSHITVHTYPEYHPETSIADINIRRIIIKKCFIINKLLN